MASNVYEGMFILDSNRYGRDPEAVSGQINQIIEKAGGEILVSRLWEERRLAYPIRGQRKGTYWLTYFRVDGRRIPDIERRCQLSDSVMRAMFVKIDARIVDTLVEHAMAGPTSSRRDQHGPPVRPGAVSAAKGAPVKPAEDSAAKDGPAVEVAEKPGDDASSGD